MVSIDLTGKVTIVTGAASGLGKAIALRFAEAGSAVAVADINYDGAVLVSDEIKKMGVKSTAVKIDTTKEEQFDTLIDTTVKELGDLDIMINNAGIGIMKPILDFSPEEIDRLLTIDLRGTIFGSRAAAKYMLKKKSGKIINTSSIAAKLGVPGATIYAAAKNGVIAFTNTLAREVAEYNINVNSICPGIIRTNMWESQLKSMSNDEAKKNQIFESYVSSSIPMKRPQEAVDIANTALFLCSDLAKNITAQSINVDGGSALF